MSPEMTRKEIIEIIEKQQPEFVKACSNPDLFAVLAVSQEAFGDTNEELLALACTVKYAGYKNRQILFVPKP